MTEEFVGGVAVWRFELDHIQVPVKSLQEAEKVTAVISKMTYPANRLCVVILANGEAIGFPPEFLEADIIRTVAQLAAAQDVRKYSLNGQIASVDGQCVTVELGFNVCR